MRGGPVALLALGATSCGGPGFAAASSDASSDATSDVTGGDVRTTPLEAGHPSPGDGGAKHDAASSSSDAEASDAGAATDSGGVVDSGVVATGWCATHPSHAWCDDFDAYHSFSDVTAIWTDSVMSAGKIALDTANPTSPPNDLIAETVATSNVKAILARPAMIAPGTREIVLEFDLRVDAAANVGLLSAVAIAALLYGPTIDDGAIAIVVQPGPSLAVTYLAPADAGLTLSLPPPTLGAFPTMGTWAGRYSLHVHYGVDAGGPCATVEAGPSKSDCLRLPASLAAHPAVEWAAVGLSAGGSGNTGSVSVQFDNVTFDALP